MTESQENTIRFRCGRCFCLLEVPASAAGTRRQCPRCYRVWEVPRESTADRPLEEYAVRDGTDWTPEPDVQYVTLICTVCQARLHATVDRVGREIVCPDCGTPAVVPPPETKEARAKKPAAPLEAYALQDEVDGDAAGPRPSQQTFVRVICSLCNTLMQAAEDQVGHQIVCPDCGTSSTVHPPAERPAALRSGDVAVGDGAGYVLAEEANRPPGQSAAEQVYVAVLCPVCGTRLHATEDQVGKEIVCPDCDRPVVVPAAPPKPKPKPNLRVASGKDYLVGKAATVPEFKSLFVPPRWHTRLDGSGSEEARPLPLPPRWPMITGVFGFPFSRSARNTWLALSAGAALFLYVLVGGSSVGSGVVTLYCTMASIAFACVIGLILAVAGSVRLLAVLGDTACGLDEVENWPEPPYFDWMGESFFVINAGLFSAMPWFVLTRLFDFRPTTDVLLLVEGSTLLFPIVLLAMLEANSPVSPVSSIVAVSLIRAWAAWVMFYAESAVLAVVACGFASAAVVWIPWLGLFLAAILLTAAIMIYFRLLGRLAWCIAAKLHEKRTQSEAPPDE